MEETVHSWLGSVWWPLTPHPSPNCGRSDTSALPLSASVYLVQVCFLLTANVNVLYRCLVYAFLDPNLVINHLSTLENHCLRAIT